MLQGGLLAGVRDGGATKSDEFATKKLTSPASPLAWAAALSVRLPACAAVLPARPKRYIGTRRESLKAHAFVSCFFVLISQSA
jgi:hypothetical protein